MAAKERKGEECDILGKIHYGMENQESNAFAPKGKLQLR